jgi:hypothetical protein
MDRLMPGQSLQQDQSIVSNNGAYQFVVQGDGNLVLYRTADHVPLWASNTAVGRAGASLIMQQDGNLVLYGAYIVDFDPGAPQRREVLWASGTDGRVGSYLVMQDDGNAVVYYPTYPVWASNTWEG